MGAHQTGRASPARPGRAGGWRMDANGGPAAASSHLMRADSALTEYLTSCIHTASWYLPTSLLIEVRTATHCAWADGWWAARAWRAANRMENQPKAIGAAQAPQEGVDGQPWLVMVLWAQRVVGPLGPASTLLRSRRVEREVWVKQMQNTTNNSIKGAGGNLDRQAFASITSEQAARLTGDSRHCFYSTPSCDARSVTGCRVACHREGKSRRRKKNKNKK